MQTFLRNFAAVNHKNVQFVMQEILELINGMSPYLLLGFLLAGLMHSFIPGKYLTHHLSSPDFRSVLKAAAIGIPLPLCSCGVIPTAMSLRKEGASKGAVTSFLIATPQTGVDSILATYSLMGPAFAFVRPLAALVASLAGGGLVNWLASERRARLAPAVPGGEEEEGEAKPCAHATRHGSLRSKMQEALRYAFVEMMQDIGKWLAIGILVAGVITVAVPDDLFDVFRGDTMASMLLVLAISIPMYLCATGSIPIAVALMLKGLTPGAAMVLLMAGPACNMASILVVRKVLGMRTLCVYLTSIIVCSVAFGSLIDWMQFGGMANFLPQSVASGGCCEETAGWFHWACTILLAMLLIHALAFPHKSHDGCECHCHEGESRNASTYHVVGMTCHHCCRAVENAVSALPTVKEAHADLHNACVTVEGDATEEEVRQAVESLGFGWGDDER